MFFSLPRDQRARASHLFKDHRSNILIDSILEGHLGDVKVDNPDIPKLAQLSYADVVIYGGDTKHHLIEKFIADVPINKAILSMPQDWTDTIRKRYGDRLTTFQRFSFSNKYICLDKLDDLIENLPSGFKLQRLNIELTKRAILSKDAEYTSYIKNYPSIENFVKNGIGFCILSESGEIVSLAASYAYSNRGIDVQIDTHPDFRNQGLATVVCAALISHCITHDIEPHWSTISMESRRLAERLGYKYKDTHEVLVRTQ